ncbi:MAG: cell wall-binding repeat-containing protein [Desulfitobacteriaceae bacterium]|nr:cell wall-binding repeat-containing protein [Desulfitobacteriaceae bacterium]MDI6915712.1 cell wall-binding repeat-containing protein [Desulfitobacteriaceae bacterium]
MKEENLQHVILASGNNFPDALASSVLAAKRQAPVLLAESNIESSSEAFAYIRDHLNPSGTVTIVGGTGVIPVEFQAHLRTMGYSNIVQIGGQDRYETAELIAEQVDAATGTPVVMTTGEDFPDALTISSFAAAKGWPILLVSKDYLPDSVQSYLTHQNPTKVYLIGNANSVSADVESQVERALPSAAVVRLSGNERYQTERAVLDYFAPNASNVYLASGTVFADALAGGVLAARTGAPIILLDNNYTTPPAAIAAYLQRLKQPEITVFGGSGAISETLAASVHGFVSPDAKAEIPALSAEAINRTFGTSVALIVTYDAQQQPLALGSGFLTTDGKVVTNYHVVKGAASVKVTVNNKSYTLTSLTAYNEARDVAVLKLPETPAEAVTIADSSQVAAGEDVVAIGAPEGLSNTVSTGIVSSASRNVNGQEWIQITAPVSHGSSGGPVFNDRGEVIGMVTWGFAAGEAQNLNFIVPANAIKPYLSSGGTITLASLLGTSGSSLPAVDPVAGGTLPIGSSGNSPVVTPVATKMSDAEFAAYLNKNYGTLVIQGKSMHFTWKVNDFKLGQDVNINGFIQPNDFGNWLELLLDGYKSEIERAFSAINRDIATNYPGKTFWGSVTYQDYYSFYPRGYEPSEVSYSPYKDAWLVTHIIVSFFDFRFGGVADPTVRVD